MKLLLTRFDISGLRFVRGRLGHPLHWHFFLFVLGADLSLAFLALLVIAAGFFVPSELKESQERTLLGSLSESTSESSASSWQIFWLLLALSRLKDEWESSWWLGSVIVCMAKFETRGCPHFQTRKRPWLDDKWWMKDELQMMGCCTIMNGAANVRNVGKVIWSWW